MSEVKLDANGLTTPSISLCGNILSAEDNKLLWNGEEFKSSNSGSGHNVGEQWLSMDGTIPFGGLPFLGQIVSKETYIDLFNWAKTNGRFKTESEWQTLYTANNGNVSFYAYDGKEGKKAHADFSDELYAHLYEGTGFYGYSIEEEEYIFDKDVTLESIKEYANHISENSNFDVEIIYLENETYAFNFIAKEVGSQFNDITITHINVPGLLLGESASVGIYTTGGEDEVLSDTFRLPSFKGYLKADSGSGYIKQGLPNIKGSIQANTNDTVTAYTGAFYADTASSGGGDTGGSGGFARFDASRYNAIYGRSSNVTPETSKIVVGVYAFNTVVNGTIFDAADEITSDILVSIAKPFLHIGYPYADSSGALLSLRSINYANNPGGFELIVDDGTNQKSLIGKADGTFTWTGKPVITLTSSWRSGKNWYRKYSDGWIEQGGVINYGSGATKWNKSVSLNTSFTTTNYNVITTVYDGDPSGDRYQQNVANIISLTTSSFKVYQCGSDAIQYLFWYACGY